MPLLDLQAMEPTARREEERVPDGPAASNVSILLCVPALDAARTALWS